MPFSREHISSKLDSSTLSEPFDIYGYSYVNLKTTLSRCKNLTEIQSRAIQSHNSRIEAIKSRLELIKDRILTLKEAVNQKLDTFLNSSTPEPLAFKFNDNNWRQPTTCQSLIELFSPENLSNQRVDDECEEELDFAQFDRFRKNNVKSASLYSNPYFFLQEWMANIQTEKTPQKSIKKTPKIVKTSSLPTPIQPPSPPASSKQTDTDLPPAPPSPRESIPDIPSIPDVDSDLPPAPPTIRTSIPTPPPFSPPKPALEDESIPEPPSIPSRRSIPPPPPPLPSHPSTELKPEAPSLPPEIRTSVGESSIPNLPTDLPTDVPPVAKESKRAMEDMPSLDAGDDESNKEEREGAIMNLLSEIKKQKTKQRKVEMKVEEKEYLNPFELAIRNVNRSKLRKVKTRDDYNAKSDNSSATPVTAGNGIFDVLALRSAMHEESEEDVAADDEDWS